MTAFVTVPFQTGGKSAIPLVALKDCSVPPTRSYELPGEAAGTHGSLQGVAQVSARGAPRRRAGGRAEIPGRAGRASVQPAAAPGAAAAGNALPPAKGRALRGCLKQPWRSAKRRYKAASGKPRFLQALAFSSLFLSLLFSLL